MCGFSVYQALTYNEIHINVCSLNRLEFNQDFSCEDEKKYFPTIATVISIFYEITIFQIVTLQGKLNRSGDSQISISKMSFLNRSNVHDTKLQLTSPRSDIQLKNDFSEQV